MLQRLAPWTVANKQDTLYGTILAREHRTTQDRPTM
jgi:hypothetical protein